jgi:hypothetical protein
VQHLAVGSPDNSAPPRPPSVPPDARWDPGKHPGFEWKHGELDGDGKKHGLYRSWTRDGVLHAESMYDHGELNGTNKNFHPDGTVSSEATWVRGVIMDSVYFRSDNPTTEPFAQAAPNVWSVRYYTRDGKTNYTIRYFTRDGVECGPDGKPLPARPASVSADARWFPDMDRWVDGEIERGTNAQVGHWRWWQREGVLRHEEQRDAKGQATMVADYRGDSTLEKKTTRDASGEERDYYFDDGKLSIRRRDDAQGREIYKGSWYRDGSLDEEKTRVYDGDALASVTERGDGGALAFEARREGPAMACVLYGKDGKTHAATGMIADGKLHGTWRLFDETGAVRREADLGKSDVEQEPTGDGLEWSLGQALYRLDVPELPDVPELAGVDGEPWSELSGAYCEHVEEFPRLMRALAAPDPLVRRFALGGIDSEIEHQGSTYPATAHAIPYLARLLAHPNADRGRLLSVIQCAGEAALPYVEQVSELDEDDDDRIGIEGTVKAVATAWPHIFALFPRASVEERRKILVIAKLAPEARASVIDVARNDADPAMRACAVDSLASGEYDVADVLPALTDRDLLVRAAAAIAIGCTKGPEAPRDAVSALGDAVRGWRDLAPRFGELPYTDGHVLAYLALATGSIRTPDARSLAQPLYGAIDEVDARSAITYGQGLLALALGDGKPPFAKRFVEILDAIARSKKFWVFNVNAHEVLDRWNLPREPEELAALVAGLEAAGDPESVMRQRMTAGDQDDET